LHLLSELLRRREAVVSALASNNDAPRQSTALPSAGGSKRKRCRRSGQRESAAHGVRGSRRHASSRLSIQFAPFLPAAEGSGGLHSTKTRCDGRMGTPYLFYLAQRATKCLVPAARAAQRAQGRRNIGSHRTGTPRDYYRKANTPEQTKTPRRVLTTVFGNLIAFGPGHTSSGSGRLQEVWRRPVALITVASVRSKSSTPLREVENEHKWVRWDGFVREESFTNKYGMLTIRCTVRLKGCGVV